MIVYEGRASAILYHLVCSHTVEGPFLLPANVCPIVPLTLIKAGRSFEFIDISPHTLAISHELVAERWTMRGLERPAGLLYVRSYGAIFDAAEIFRFIKSEAPDALIVDDRCLCAPCFESSVPSDVDALIYSTGYGKYVDVGFGGFCFLKDGIPYIRGEIEFSPDELEETISAYKYAIKDGVFYRDKGLNWLDTSLPRYPWDEYRALVEAELVQVERRKCEINEVYASSFPHSVQFPKEFQSWRFNIHVSNKERVLAAVMGAGFFASGHYDALNLTFGPGSGEMARLVSSQVVNFFNDRYFSTDQASRMVDVLIGTKVLSPGSLFQ